MSLADGKRSTGIDLLRFAAVVSIIFLHVVLSNTGQGTANNIIAVLCSIFTNETLVFLSLLLSLAKLNAVDDFRSFLASRFVRLGAPFLGFTVLYVLLDAAGPQQGVIFRFLPASAAALLLFAGLGEYHLHFLPALLCLTVIAPIFMRSLSFPNIIITFLIGDGVRFLFEYMVLGDGNPGSLTAAQLLLLHAGKIAAYVPFGFLAQWFVSHEAAMQCCFQQNRVIKYSLTCAIFVILTADLSLMNLAPVAAGGRLGLLVFVEEILGTLLIVTGIFLVAAYTSDFAGGRRAAGYGQLYSRAFLVLMIHPLLLKVFDWVVAVHSPGIVSNVLRGAFVLSASWVVAGALKKIADRIRPAVEEAQRSFAPT